MAPLVPYAITICGIPELPQHASSGVSHVLSIVDAFHPTPPAIAAYGAAGHEILRFDDVVAEHPGFDACNEGHLASVLAFGEKARADAAGHVLVHCHAGISRSTAAAAILMAQFNPGRETEAFAELLDLRPHAWPNTRMVEFADRLLARRGALLAGLVEYRRAMLARRPHLAEAVRNIGRGHEIP